MFAKTIISSLLAAGFAAAHIQMTWPYPLRSEFDPANDWDEIDYSMTNPLHADGMYFTFPWGTSNNNSRFRLPLQGLSERPVARNRPV